MELFFQFLFLVLGFLMLVKGAGWFVVGTTALITPVVFEAGFLVDSMIAVVAGLLLLICVFREKKLKRAGGVVMLLGYAAYYVYLLV